MKKTIQSLLNKLEVADSGKITGGFSRIKGGTSSLSVLADNPSGCDNKNTCSGTNGGCTNGIDCTKSTNSGTACTNSLSCLM